MKHKRTKKVGDKPYSKAHFFVVSLEKNSHRFEKWKPQYGSRCGDPALLPESEYKD